MKCFILLITSIILLSCGSDEITEPVATRPNYFPDVAGSRWVYKNDDIGEWSREITNQKETQDNNYQTFTYHGLLSETNSDFIRPEFFQVSQDKILLDVSDKVNHYIQSELPNSVQDSFTGLDIDVAITPITHLELIYLYQPLTSNLRWDSLNVKVQGDLSLQDLTLLHFPFETNINISAVVLGQGKIETPAGTFDDTYQIEYHIESSHKVFSDEVTAKQVHSIWFTPHVGIVKIEDNSGVSELVEYTLK